MIEVNDPPRSRGFFDGCVSPAEVPVSWVQDDAAPHKPMRAAHLPLCCDEKAGTDRLGPVP